MSPLAGDGGIYEPPASFRDDVGPVSHVHAKLLWCGLSVGTRRSYGPARRSYERYCAFEFPGQQAWPATLEKLCGWVCARAVGSHGESRIRPKTIAHYLAALRSVHVDKRLNTAVFANEHLKRLVDGAKRLDTDSTVSVRRPITLSILEKIVNPAPPPSASLSPAQLDSLRVDTAFKVAFAGFLRMGEFTYNKAELKDRTTFQKERPLLGDVVIKPSHATFTLILPEAFEEKPVPRRLDPLGAHGLLYLPSSCTGSPPASRYSAHQLTTVYALLWLLLPLRAPRHSLHPAQGRWPLARRLYGTYSFRKGTAQTALDRGLSKEDIQLLGRWSSDAVELYYKHAEENIVRLSRKLLSTSPLPGSTMEKKTPEENTLSSRITRVMRLQSALD